ncbi:MAG: HAMP domain-containing histidine kinase [Solobacterium sp.]|nr:HAMP domain-containing histidine kinase [Solobacterium sp.]
MKKLNSLGWVIGLCLSAFAILVIALLFFFQTVLLEPMYEYNQVQTVKTVSNAVSESIGASDLDDVIYEATSQTDTCVRVFRSNEYVTTDQTGPSENVGCLLYRMPLNEIGEYIVKAEESEDQTHLAVTSERRDPSAKNRLKNIIYTRVMDTDFGKAAVMVYSNISSVSAASRTLASQLLYIGMIMILFICLLTYVLYRVIARPLVQINRNAKTLPQGEYTEDPKTNRYREAQELNQTLNTAAEDIRKADRAKRDLIANVSHDLRTPLTMISGYGEMMLDLPDEKTDENIHVIVDEAHRLTTLVNDLLDLSRMQENKVSLNMEIFDIAEMIRRETRKYEGYAQQEGCTIEVHTDEHAWVSGDISRMEQVVNNFLSNALNYGAGGGKIIVRQTHHDGYVRTEVRDFGEGIAPEDIRNIWDRYYKVDKTHVRASGGSGSGLAIVKEILELHHAKYGVSSQLHEGSTFWFELEEQKI